MRFKFWNLIVFFGLIFPLVTGADLFNFIKGNKAGSCDGREDKLQLYVDDAKLLAKALQTVFHNAPTNVVAQKLVSAFFKINFVKAADGTIVVKPEDSKHWDHIRRVSNTLHNFLNFGQKYPYMEDPPLIYCDDTFAQQLAWTSPALDSNGNPIKARGQSLKIQDVYQMVKDQFPRLVPWWINDEKGFMFAAKEDGGRLCGSRVNAVTIAGYRGRELIKYGVSPSDMTFKDVVVLCRYLFLGPEAGPKRLSESQYVDPIARPNIPMAYFIPQSNTFFHEMVHLVTSHMHYDPFVQQGYNNPRGYWIADWAYGAPDVLALDRDKAVDNAQTYAYIALAWWYYANNWGRDVTPVTFYNGEAVPWYWPESP